MHLNAAPAVRGVNAEVDSPQRLQGLPTGPQPPAQPGPESDHIAIDFRDQQHRWAEGARHVLPAKEFRRVDAIDVERPASERRRQVFKDAGFVFSLKGPNLDAPLGRIRARRRHCDRTIVNGASIALAA